MSFEPVSNAGFAVRGPRIPPLTDNPTQVSVHRGASDKIEQFVFCQPENITARADDTVLRKPLTHRQKDASRRIKHAGSFESQIFPLRNKPPGVAQYPTGNPLFHQTSAQGVGKPLLRLRAQFLRRWPLVGLLLAIGLLLHVEIGDNLSCENCRILDGGDRFELEFLQSSGAKALPQAFELRVQIPIAVQRSQKSRWIDIRRERYQFRFPAS